MAFAALRSSWIKRESFFAKRNDWRWFADLGFSRCGKYGHLGVAIRFRIRSGPAGTHCMWEAQQNLNARPNWQIEALNFVSNSTGPCFIGGNDTDRDRAPPTGGTIRHDHVFVGKFARIELSRLSQPSHVFPTMHVALECPITGTNDRFAVVRWDSVELIGPEDETVGQAF